MSFNLISEMKIITSKFRVHLTLVVFHKRERKRVDIFYQCISLVYIIIDMLYHIIKKIIEIVLVLYYFVVVSKTHCWSTNNRLFYCSFPNDPIFKSSWIHATKRENWFPTAQSVTCSSHFTEDCFLYMKNRHTFGSIFGRSAVLILYEEVDFFIRFGQTCLTKVVQLSL